RSASAWASDAPSTCIWPSAAAVSSTAVFSVSVANCSRCVSWTVSAWRSANSRSAPGSSSGSPPPNGKKPPLPSMPSRLRELDPVAGLDLALQLLNRPLRRLQRSCEGRGAARVELALEATRCCPDLVETRGRRELRRLADDVAESLRGGLGRLDPVGRLSLAELGEARQQAVEIASSCAFRRDLAHGRDRRRRADRRPVGDHGRVPVDGEPAARPVGLVDRAQVDAPAGAGL